MKSFLSGGIFLLITSFLCYSQGGWHKQETNIISELRGIAFFNNTNGYVVGYEETILNTSDGGNIWNLQKQNSSVFFNLNG